MAAEKPGSQQAADRSAESQKQRRGDLRKQVSEQLTKLQAAPQGETAPQQRAMPPQREATMGIGGMLLPSERVEEESASPPTSSGAGHLSLDLDLTPVGTAYHFRKLHGEPRLVLDVRHEAIRRSVLAVVWAALCLVLATAVVQGLRRPNAAALALRHWPWFALLIGAIWLFLLPVGVLGLVLLITASCILIGRLRKPESAGLEMPKIAEEKAVDSGIDANRQ